MKQIIMLIVTSVILICAGIWEINYLNDSSQYVLSDVSYSKNAINNNNFALAKGHIKDIEETWNDIKPVWTMFVDHLEIDNVEESLLKYKVYIESENKEESLHYAEELDRAFRHIVEKQSVKTENVF